MTGSPIFCYHDVVRSDEALASIAAAHRPYVLTRAQLVAHLDALVGVTADGIAVARTVGEVVDAPGAGRFALSFDDGHESGYTEVLPLLAERGWRATFFVVAGWVGEAHMLGWGQLRAMADAGMEIGSHSLTHPFMNALSPDAVRREFEDSKRILEDGLGRPVHVASLPRGSAAPGMAAIVAELGYRAFCTSEPGLVSATTNPFDAPRIAIKWRTSAPFLLHVLAGHRLTLATLRSSYAVKRLGKRLVGAERWRRVRGAVITGTERAGQ